MQEVISSASALIVLISCISLGRAFVSGFLALELFVGLSFVALVITPLVFIDVKLIRPSCILLILVGLLKVAWSACSRQPFHFERIKSKFVQIRLGKELIALTAPAVAFSNLISSRYVFENHDVLYLGWVQEAFNDDSNGPLKLPTLYPVLSGANHFFNSSLVLIMGILNKDLNLAMAQNLKYILIVTFFYLIIRDFKVRNQLKILFGMLLPWALFNREIGYEFVISSFGYLMILTLILYILIREKTPKLQNIQILLLILSVSKAPIFFVPILVFIVIHVRMKKFEFHKKNILFLALTVINILSWVITPKSTGSGSGIPQFLGLHPKFVSGRIDFGFERIAQSFNPWYLGAEGEIIEKITSHGIKVVVIFMLILLKVYLPYFLILRKLLEHPARMILDTYMLVGLFSWLFIRHVGNMSQISHMYLLQSLVTFTLMSWKITLLSLKFRLFFAALGLVIVIPLNALPVGMDHLNRRNNMPASVNLKEANSLFLTETDLLLAKRQVIHSIHGVRLEYKKGGDYRESVVYIFSQR